MIMHGAECAQDLDFSILRSHEVAQPVRFLTLPLNHVRARFRGVTRVNSAWECTHIVGWSVGWTYMHGDALN